MKKKGAALLVVVIVMTTAFFIAAIVVDRSIKSSRRISETLNDTKAYYYAESLVYDMVNCIGLKYNNANVPAGLYRSKVDNPYNIDVFADSSLLSDYNVKLTSNVVQTYKDAVKTEYTYNVEAEVTYSKRRYTVKLQVVTVYNGSTYSGHRINDKKVFKS